MPETTSSRGKASFRLATPFDNHLERYDNTKLTAMGVCPTWGVVRYHMHKRMPSKGRNMALECGHTMHQVFSWVRLCTLWQQLPDNAVREQLFTYHGARLFGHTRLEHIQEQAGSPADDLIDYTKRGAIAVLDTSGYYDDERDKRRTLSNLEEASFHYIDRWQWRKPVWVRTPDDPKSDVGIELPFEMVVEIDDTTFVHTGRIDGIHTDDDRVVLHENKTASRLNDAWEMSFDMSSQITAYCIAASVITERQVRSAEIIGLSIPLPRSYDYGGFVRTTTNRENHHFSRWIRWLAGTVDMYRMWGNDPLHAPQFTHSCSRYFRPCSLIPLCVADNDEQKAILDELVFDEWSPLDDQGEVEGRD
jgi:hypothetical protein